MNLTEEFQGARRDKSLVVLEGLHALKHARRFGAEIVRVVADDAPGLVALAEQLAPESVNWLKENMEVVEPKVFETLSPTPPETRVIAIAKRAEYSLDNLLASNGRIVVLDHPSHPGNIGAVNTAADNN